MTVDLSPEELKSIMDKTSNHYEIERKFLLKNIPENFKKLAKKEQIVQYYLRDDSTSGFTPAFTRIRKLTNKGGTITYIKTSKMPAGTDYAMHEIEVELSEYEFKKYEPLICRVIDKCRYTLKIDGLKWEVDEFNSIRMIMAEVEMIAKSFKESKIIEKQLKEINIPPSIQEQLIIEVTGEDEFYNVSLADTTSDCSDDVV